MSVVHFRLYCKAIIIIIIIIIIYAYCEILSFAEMGTFFAFTNLRIWLYVCALRRFNCCKILQANDRYRSNGDRNIYGIT